MKELSYCFGMSFFLSDYRIKKLMGSKFVAPTLDGVYYHGKQRVYWACKNADDMVFFYLSKYGRQNMECMATVEHIDTTVAINNEKGYSYANLVVIIRWSEGESWKEDKELFALANVKCTKDNAIILREYFSPRLNERIIKKS